MLFLVSWLVACSGGSETPHDPVQRPTPNEIPAEDPAVIATRIPKVKFRFDQAIGDPSVPAEQGGPGFTGEGWLTTSEVYQLGNPDAPQGGSLVTNIPDWPATLRMAGENWNTMVNYTIATLMYETLLGLDPVTQEYIPRLATHWWISPDKTTYRFRINPAAKWSTGEPVTADDVVASWRLQMSEGIRYPAASMVFGKFSEPVAVSKYVVEVKAVEESWKNFLEFSTDLLIFPAKELGTLNDTSPKFKTSGEAYLNTYQFAYPANSGPYIVKPGDIKTGESVTFTRNRDWWAENDPTLDGWYNIDRVQFVVVKDDGLAFEKVKKGELDYYSVARAQWWVEEVPKIPDVQRGLLQPRKFFTNAPIGVQGMALNSERPPLDDPNLRLALQHLYDRETMISKLFFGEYEPLTSYYQNSAYANPGNALIPYDEVTAVELLEKSGWTEKNADGYRVKDGKELKLTVNYRSQGAERYLTVFQESCKRAGIHIELQLLNDSTHWKNVTERSYEVSEMAWGANVFPSADTTWHSTLADTKDNNNITAYRNPRVDALIEAYGREYDIQKRIAIMREMDGLIYQDHPYVLAWFNPAQRVLYRNKFGMPRWGSPRTARSLSDRFLFEIWWVDPAKEAKLAAAQADPSMVIEKEPIELHFWKQWSAAQGLTEAGTESMEVAPAPAPGTP